MRRYTGTFDVFFGLEHRLKKGGNGGTIQQRERPRKDGGLQRAQQELLRKWQAMRIISTRQEEFLL